MSGVPMPNFMNIGSSLRRELDEDFDDNNEDNCMMENLSRMVHTPDLIIEGEESDSEQSQLSVMEELTAEEGMYIMRIHYKLS
jgi:hypothetical protein